MNENRLGVVANIGSSFLESAQVAERHAAQVKRLRENLVNLADRGNIISRMVKLPAAMLGVAGLTMVVGSLNGARDTSQWLGRRIR